MAAFLLVVAAGCSSPGAPTTDASSTTTSAPAVLPPPTATLTTTVPSGAVPPAPAADTVVLEATQTIAEAPPGEGIGVIDGDRLVLIDDTGAVLGSGDGDGWDQRLFGLRFNLDVAVGRWRLTPEPRVTVLPPLCSRMTPSWGPTDLVAMICGTDARVIGRYHLERAAVVPVADVPPPLGEAPDGIPNPLGRWRWVVPSPDGSAILAQWSGECERSVSFVVDLTDRSMVPIGDGDSGNWDLDGYAAFGVGWLDDGRAVAAVWEPLCGGAPAAPGIYLWDGSAAELIYESESSGAYAFVWRRADWTDFGNPTESALGAAFKEMGVVPCCGEPAHGVDGATTGFIWAGREVLVVARPLSAPDGYPAEALRDPTPVGRITVGTLDRGAGPATVFLCADVGFTVVPSDGGPTPAEAIESLVTALGCG